MRKDWFKTPSAIYTACRCTSRPQSTSFFSTWPALAVKQLPPRPKLDDKDITGSYLKGTGPGGQKIVRNCHPILLQRHLTTGVVMIEQNKLRRPTHPQTNRHRSKIPSNALPLPKSKDRKRDSRCESRGFGKGGTKSGSDQECAEEETKG
jgi:hypothetical protein